MILSVLAVVLSALGMYVGGYLHGYQAGKFAAYRDAVDKLDDVLRRARK